MSQKLLIIDPQNDFMDQEGAALPVTGAMADTARLIQLLDCDKLNFSEIIVTLDSHASYGVERTTFWQDSQGREVAPFTPVTVACVKSGKVQPKDLSKLSDVLDMLSRLEGLREGPMMVWPVHCVTGTWGHNIEQSLAKALARWESRNLTSVQYVFKGQSPMTEHFSAIKADVVLADDPRTAPNFQLLNSLGSGQHDIFVAGQAASHCVASTVYDYWATLSPSKRKNVILLEDCMSPVTGFESAAQELFAKAREYGCPVIKSQSLIASSKDIK